MATLVEDLLTLARLDEGRPLGISTLIRSSWLTTHGLQACTGSSAPRAPSDSPSTVALPDDLIVPADRDRISVFTSLIREHHCATRRTVHPSEIALGRSGDTAIVELRDPAAPASMKPTADASSRFHASTGLTPRATGARADPAWDWPSSRNLTRTEGRRLPDENQAGLTVRIELPMA